MKVAIFLAEGYEEIEAVTIIDILRRGEVNLKIFGLNSNKIEGSHNIIIETDDIFSIDKLSNFDGIIFPGGLTGVTNLKNNQNIIELVKDFNLKNKWICAICAAPMILDHAGILKDKKVTIYPALKDELKTISKYSEDNVIVDKNIITSRGPATAIDFALKLLEIWISKEESSKISSDLLANCFYE